MKRTKFLLGLIITFATFSCINSKSNPENQIEIGNTLFTNNCSSCHNFQNDGIGPNLAGITSEISTEEIIAFIVNPKGVIESNNERASVLYAKYKSIMPAFNYLKENELESVIAYIKTKENVTQKDKTARPNFLEDPIQEVIKMSTLKLELEFAFEIPFSNEKLPHTRITKMEPRQNSDELFILDMNNILYKIVDNNPVEYLNMAALMPKFLVQPGLGSGFGSFAFHPDFDHNGLLYTTHTEPASSAKADFPIESEIPIKLQWVLQEWKTSNPYIVPFKGQNREVLRIDMVTQIHGMQNLAFNPNAKTGHTDFGNLYIGIGDGGASESGFDYLTNTIEKPWGSILRIDPKGKNSNNGKYGIPLDNPFYIKSNAVKEVFANGFRNPHRFTWSSEGKMIVSNIGHRNIESVYVVKKGSNQGWPYREGSFEIDPKDNMQHVFALPNNNEIDINYPSIQYDHDEGNAICGGFIYTNTKLTALKGKYLFGDMLKGRIFMADEAKMIQGEGTVIEELTIVYNKMTTTLLTLSKSDHAKFRMGIDTIGELYIWSMNDGKVYKITNVF